MNEEKIKTYYYKTMTQYEVQPPTLKPSMVKPQYAFQSRLAEQTIKTENIIDLYRNFFQENKDFMRKNYLR